MQIHWLASYPRSGNTFVRMLLNAALYGDSGDTDVVAERVPGLHALLAAKRELELSGTAPRLVKTHFRHTADHPYGLHTTGFIYILRNPRDVLPSAARYLGATASRAALREFALTFIESLGAARWRERYGGTWPEHVESWQRLGERLPHLIVRYEDLRADTAAVLGRMLAFLGVEVEEARLRAAAEACAIERARAHEAAEQAAGRARIYNRLPNGERFVGDGLSGQSLAFLGADVEARFRERFGPLIAPFGYE